MKKYQKEALILAKNSILEKFGDCNLSGYLPTSQELYEKKSCFITIKTLNNQLRGCIGTVIATRELYLDIISNAKSSAFNDYRFDSLLYNELNDLYIEITILSPLKLLIFDSIENLYIYLGNNKPGLIIELGNKSATFLPSVWHELTDPEKFIHHLLLKAGIKNSEFIENFGKVKIKEYYGEEFGEYFKNI